jgi:hypothetical protein
VIGLERSPCAEPSILSTVAKWWPDSRCRCFMCRPINDGTLQTTTEHGERGLPVLGEAPRDLVRAGLDHAYRLFELRDGVTPP